MKLTRSELIAAMNEARRDKYHAFSGNVSVIELRSLIRTMQGNLKFQEKGLDRAGKILDDWEKPENKKRYNT